MNNLTYNVGDESLNSIEYRACVGVTVGDITVDGLLPKSYVDYTCNRCNSSGNRTRWYKIKSGHTTSCGCKHKLKTPEKYIGTVCNKLTIKHISKNKDMDGAVLCKAECTCGNVVEKRLNVLLRGKVMSCGNCSNRIIHTLPKEDKSDYTRILDIWRQMMKRCYQSGKHVTNNPELLFLNKDKEHSRYNGYGARSIKVYSKWTDRDVFYKWYKDNIKPGESMDRIDNDSGYHPDNLRSANASVQNVNQRVRVDNKTGYKGIRYSGYSYLWVYRLNGKSYKQEGYNSTTEALLDRNLVLYENGLSSRVIGINEVGMLNIMFRAQTKKYHLGVSYHNIDKPTKYSKKGYSSRDNKVLKEVLKLMNIDPMLVKLKQ